MDRTFTRSIAAFAAAALVLVSGATAAEAAKKSKAKTTKPVAKKVAAKSIVDIAVSNPDFSTLVTAVKTAGLVETLNGPGPFTVFAPTNAAFAKVPKATLDAVLADKKMLTDILTYHVVAGKVLSVDVAKLDGKSAKTVNGAEVKIAVKDGKVFLNDNVMVTATDIVASNGVIHVIDAVLLPPAAPAAATPAPAAPAAATPAPAAAKTIVDIAAGNPDFSTLVTAVKAAGLVETLSGPGPFTVFAPTNEAFAKLPKATLDAVLADKKVLTDILTYHVVAGKVLAADVVKLDGKSAKTVNGAEVKIAVSGGKVTLNGNVNVTATDIIASNGVIHVIDTVLLPPAAAPATGAAPAAAGKSIVDIAAGDARFSTLVAAVKAAGLVDTLNGAGPFTVFAPTNTAFAVLGEDTIKGLLKPENKKALTDILLYHVVAGKVGSADVVKTHAVKTVLGKNVNVSLRDGGVFINSARIQIVDLQASNGVIHVIDTVLLP
jgi:transforming growth factor-beta-induced protein